jgi:hypothetical protein
VSSGMLRRVALLRTDVSEKLSASFIRVTRIDELGTKLAIISNLLTLRRNTKYKGGYFLPLTVTVLIMIVICEDHSYNFLSLCISSQRASGASYSLCCS